MTPTVVMHTVMWVDGHLGPTRPPWLSQSLVPIGLCRSEAQAVPGLPLTHFMYSDGASYKPGLVGGDGGTTGSNSALLF